MAKTQTKAKDKIVRLKLPSDYAVGMDQRGNIVAIGATDNEEEGAWFGDERGEILVTAKELDQIAADAKAFPSLVKEHNEIDEKIAELEARSDDIGSRVENGEMELRQTDAGIEINHREDGGVNFGCQNIPAKLLARGHKLSLAMRQRNKRSRARS